MINSVKNPYHGNMFTPIAKFLLIILLLHSTSSLAFSEMASVEIRRDSQSDFEAQFSISELNLINSEFEIDPGLVDESTENEEILGKKTSETLLESFGSEIDTWTPELNEFASLGTEKGKLVDSTDRHDMRCNIRCKSIEKRMEAVKEVVKEGTVAETVQENGERFDIDFHIADWDRFEKNISGILFEDSERQSLPGKKLGPVYRDVNETPDIPILSNRKIKGVIKFYTVRKRKLFELAIQRSAKYMTMINRIFKEYRLPENLAYLAVVESNFNPKARSRANAVGLWQFMRRTGNSFGLHQSWWHEDRYDPEKSTIAAAQYLKQLHKRFNGDWELAMAAYNSGGGRVRRAQKKAKRQGKAQNYWNLDLPRETRGYVPAFYAVATVFQNLEAYGFSSAPIWENERSQKRLKVPGGVPLRQVANYLDLDYHQLLSLNPSLPKGITPATLPSYEIRIPGNVVLTTENIEKLTRLEKQRQKFWKYHKVKKGDSLWSISQRYDIPISKVRIFNQFPKKNLLRIGQRIMLPLPVGTAIVKKEKKHRTKFFLVKAQMDKIPGVTHTHRVEKGDTLWNISQRFGVSVKSLKSWNRGLLKKKILQIGKKILIKLPLKQENNMNFKASI